MKGFTFRNTAGAILSVAQIIASSWSELTGKGQSETEEARNYEGPLTPAPQTFGIWLPLFACGLVYSGHTLSQPGDAHSKTGWWANATFLQNILWSVNAQFLGLGWQSVTIIGGAATTAVVTTVQAEQTQDTWTANTFAPLAGWLTLASFVNLETTFNKMMGRPKARHEVVLSLAILVTALTVVWSINSRLKKRWPYNLPIAIGLTGVAVKNIREKRWSVAVACVAGIFVLGYLYCKTNRQGLQRCN